MNPPTWKEIKESMGPRPPVFYELATYMETSFQNPYGIWIWVEQCVMDGVPIDESVHVYAQPNSHKEQFKHGYLCSNYVSPLLAMCMVIELWQLKELGPPKQDDEEPW